MSCNTNFNNSVYITCPIRVSCDPNGNFNSNSNANAGLTANFNDSQLNLLTGIPGPLGLPPYTGGIYIPPQSDNGSSGNSGDSGTSGTSGATATGFAIGYPVVVSDEMFQGTFMFTVTGTNVEPTKSGCIFFPLASSYVLTVDAITDGLETSFLTISTTSLDGTISVQTDLLEETEGYLFPITSGIFNITVVNGSGTVCFGYDSDDVGATLNVNAVIG